MPQQHALVMKIFCPTARRLDIYVNNKYIPPLNAGKDANGKNAEIIKSLLRHKMSIVVQFQRSEDSRASCFERS